MTPSTRAETDAPLIVGFVSDLIFMSKIENVTRRLGYRVAWVERAADVGAAEPHGREAPGEMLHGLGGRLFELVTSRQPALLLFDLANEAIPWRRWIPALKSSPATRRIPILCFGPHEDVETMTEARRVGADLVLARSRFVADMPELFQKHARTPDHAALEAGCGEALPALVREGIALFNQGEYYKCHDALEEAWMAEQRPIRDLYRGILQVGIAFYQIERGNYRGAVKMLLRVRQWLEPLPDVCQGVNVARLRENATAVHAALVALGPDKTAAFDRSLFVPIELKKPGL
jgi:predicted metal-dependent hydrolase